LSNPSTAVAVAWPRVERAGPEEIRQVFHLILDAHYRRTYSFIYRMVRSEQDAADLTQETFIRVYKGLPRLREGAAASAWVRRIATNLCLDHIRKRNAAPPISSIDAHISTESDTPSSFDVVDHTSDPEQRFAKADSRRILLKAVNSLPDDYRVVIVLHHMEDMRVEEIADSMGVPAGTIKSRLSRARKELKRKLGGYFEIG
jgi:RNA polymerase sigma-70 factor, ECF subfamily